LWLPQALRFRLSWRPFANSDPVANGVSLQGSFTGSRQTRNPMGDTSTQATTAATASAANAVTATNAASATNESPLIQVRDLRFQRGNRWIFDGIDLDIERGKITAIMGPSGTGKTTLLRLIGGQLRPDTGSIHVDGRNIPKLSRSELFVERRKMGMLFQSGALFTDLTVFENVAFPLRIHTRLSESMIRDVVLMKLQAVGLRGARDL